MTDENTELVIRRILVALDASAQSLAALGAAANLAASLEAELVGLFVEDINLIRFASLPFARQIFYPSGAEEPLNSVSMERELRVRGERARKALATAAERAQAPWSFRIARGEVTAEILAAASEADLVFLGKAGWSPAPPMGLGSTALALVANASGALLLVQHEFCIGDPIMVIYDGSDGSQRALRIAIRLAEAGQHNLTVFLLADGAEAGEKLEAEVGHLVSGRLKRLSCRRLYSTDPHRISQAVRAEGGGLLVLGDSGPSTQEDAIQTLLGEIDNPLLLIR